MCHKSSRHTQIGSLKEKPTRRHDVKIVITVGTIKFKNHARGRQGEKKCVSLFIFQLSYAHTTSVLLMSRPSRLNAPMRIQKAFPDCAFGVPLFEPRLGRQPGRHREPRFHS